MRGVILLAGLAICLAGPLAAHEDASSPGCIKPFQPALIDKAEASSAEKARMVERLDAYIAEMNVYLACLERADFDARGEAAALLRRWAEPSSDAIIVVE